MRRSPTIGYAQEWSGGRTVSEGRGGGNLPASRLWSDAVARALLEGLHVEADGEEGRVGPRHAADDVFVVCSAREPGCTCERLGWRKSQYLGPCPLTCTKMLGKHLWCEKWPLLTRHPRCPATGHIILPGVATRGGTLLPQQFNHGVRLGYRARCRCRLRCPALGSIRARPSRLSRRGT